MTETRLKVLVTEAVQLDRYIAERQEHLKGLKAELVTEAESRPDEQTPTEGGGWSWVAQGADGCVARVMFPGPSLKGSIAGEGQAIEKVKALAGSSFSKLFAPEISYRPVGDFRSQAEVFLGRMAQKLVKLVTSKTSPKVAFETKEK